MRDGEYYWWRTAISASQVISKVNRKNDGINCKGKIMIEDRLCKNKAYFFVLKVLVSASIIGLAIIRN